MDESEAEVEVQVKDVALDPTLNVPVVLLEPKSGGVVLPIWIGAFEANAIAIFLEGRHHPTRPLTHDLFIASIDTLGGRLIKLVVSDLVDNTFISVLHLVQEGRHLTIDARPSDGIALSLRAGTPIYVHRRVFEKASSQEGTRRPDPDPDTEEESGEELPPGKPEWRM
jgi:bifunctional DNase/RNase